MEASGYLFSNHLPWVNGVAPETPVYAWSGQTEAVVGEWVRVPHDFTQWQPFRLGMYVNDTGYFFQTGEGYRNPDGLLHAQATEYLNQWGNYTYAVRVGFEDLYNYEYFGQSFPGEPDFDDVVLQVRGVSTVTPEPATMALLATGLAGIGGAGMRRRKKAKGDLETPQSI